MPVVVSLPRVKRVPLTKGYSTIVDAHNYERITSRKWCAQVHSRINKPYVRALSNINKKNTYLHHFILNIKPDRKLQVDHINRNPLDNRECNLRLVTPSKNTYNRDKVLNRKGYTYCKRWKLWYAYAPGRRGRNLGCRKTEEEIKKVVADFYAKNPDKRPKQLSV